MTEAWTDFTAKLEYKTVSGNSGVYFRMGDPDNGTERNRMGFEIEVDPTRDAGGLQKGGRGARGRIAILINGAKISELRDDPRRKAGRLALRANPRQNLDV